MQEYQSVTELGSELRDGGVNCDPEIQSQQRFSTQGGRCMVEGEELVIGIYAQPALLEEQKSFQNEVGRMLGESMFLVVGANWTVNCSSDEALAERVSTAIGGMVYETDS